MNPDEIDKLLNDVDTIQKRARIQLQHKQEVHSVNIGPIVQQKEKKDKLPEIPQLFVYQKRLDSKDEGTQVAIMLPSASSQAQTDDVAASCADGSTQNSTLYIENYAQTQPDTKESRIQQAKQLNKSLILKLQELEQQNDQLRHQLQFLTEKCTSIARNGDQQCAELKQQNSELVQQQVSDRQLIADQLRQLSNYKALLAQNDDLQLVLAKSGDQLIHAQNLLQFQQAQIANLQGDKLTLLQFIKDQPAQSDGFVQTDDCEAHTYQIAVQTEQPQCAQDLRSVADFDCQTLDFPGKNKKLQVDYQELLTCAETQTSYICRQCNEYRGEIENYKQMAAEREALIDQQQEYEELITQLQESAQQLMGKNARLEKDSAEQLRYIQQFADQFEEIRAQIVQLKAENSQLLDEKQALESEKRQLEEQNGVLNDKLLSARKLFS